MRAFLAWLLVVPAVAGTTSCVMPGALEIAPVATRPAAFDPALVRRGAALAAVGNCRSCHTARGGEPFAGGLPLESPFGTLYSTNITPHPEAGIGAWSQEAFARAMREGVDREGRHLYPAFPYDHFTLVTDEDNRALYAYLMTRTPVARKPPPHALVFPMNLRSTIGLWKRLYFRPGAWRDEPGRSALWNRGAYLAEGLAHCGACHTPRNRLGAERRERHFDGGVVDGWLAYAIDEGNQAPIAWDERAMADYLRRGWHERHGVSRGPMATVSENLAAADEADVRAIAHYVVSLMREGAAARARTPSANEALRRAALAPGDEGARIYAAACHGCHDGSQPLPFGGLPLALSIGVAGESPRNLVNVILYGLPAVEGETTPMMPGYAGALSEAQVVRLVTWLRASLTDRAPWNDVERVVRESMNAGPKLGEHPVGGAGSDPARFSDAR